MVGHVEEHDKFSIVWCGGKHFLWSIEQKKFSTLWCEPNNQKKTFFFKVVRKTNQFSKKWFMLKQTKHDEICPSFSYKIEHFEWPKYLISPIMLAKN